MKRATIALLTALLAAACSATQAVEVESRDRVSSSAPTSPPSPTSPPPPTSVSTTTTATTATTNATESTAPPTTDETSPEIVTFELDAFTVEIELRPTIAPAPPLDYDGFHTAVQLLDGTIVASGFDAAGDGIQPERSALWRSDDGERWQRVGVQEISSQVDQQAIQSLTTDGTTVRAFGNDLNTASGEFTIDSAVEWRSEDGGTTWTEVDRFDGAVENAAVVDGQVVILGAADPNEPGFYRATVAVGSAPGEFSVSGLDAEPDGRDFGGSTARDLLAMPDEWLVAGGTKRTDPSGGAPDRYVDISLPGAPVDIAIWSSVDRGSTWSRLPIERFENVPGMQFGAQLVHDGTLFWLLTVEEGLRDSHIRLLTSPDARQWTLHPYFRTDVTAGELTTVAGLYALDGAILVVDEVFDGTTQELNATVIDPATNEMVTVDLSEQLGGFAQMEDILAVDDGWLGFGRIERGPGASDLQTVEIRVRR